MSEQTPSRIAVKCPHCSHTNSQDSLFCENCGRELTQTCSRCGTRNAPDARFCKKCGTALSQSPERLESLRRAAPQALREKARLASAGIEGERKPVTILFTDIVGSTSKAEKLDPEEWKEIVSGAHRRVGEAVYRYEGTIAQLLGDGVLAFFGAPITHEDDPIRAVRAGLDIQESIGDYARELTGYVDDFQLRVGINTGTVVVGSVGSEMHMEYLAIGDAVNLAARLQSEARPGHVLISDSTAQLVKNEFDLDALGEVSVKGKTAPVPVFQVGDRKPSPESGRGIEGLVAPLVGRDRDLASLKAALTRLTEGHGQIVSVLGEAGIGKSRLVEEARLDPSLASLRWLEGRSLSYGAALSFWAISRLIESDLGLSEGEPEPKIKASLRKRGKNLFGEHAADRLPYLERLLGVRLEQESTRRLEQLDGETLKRETLWAAAEYFRALSETQPTVLVLEDAHWADPSTLEALQRLLPVTDRSPLGVLLLARIDRDHGSWQLKVKAETDHPHRYTEIQLQPLSSEDSDELVSRLMTVADLPDSVRRVILERSEGNPFYLEEIIRSLIDQGALIREAGTWRAGAAITGAEIPETLKGVLLARIDRLQDDVRRTLQLAAVIGKSFLYRLLEAISAAERELDDHLSQLQRADLVREKARRPELEYIFKHSLTQEAAYNSLLIERRREFHRKVGEALEGLFADRQEEFYGLLGHHFDAAGEPDKAIDFLIKAGDAARANDAFEEAIQHYQRAIELLEQEGDGNLASKTWLKVGLIEQVNFRFDQAHIANERAFDLAKRLRAAPSRPAAARRSGTPRTFTSRWSNLPVSTLDPSQLSFVPEVVLGSMLFAGLAELDSEFNVVPHVARSWEVLDGGTRYVFHLRDDVRWTDETPVTADDCEWTWKRNLAPDTDSTVESALDDIAGARDYREGRVPTPDGVGVRALDAHTLEVQLNHPVAYFLYAVAMPPCWPLPRRVVEEHGQEWWKPEHIVSNGPYRLLEFDDTHGVMARNPAYFGEVTSNLDQWVWHREESAEAAARSYLAGKADWVPVLRPDDIPPEVPASEVHERESLSTVGLVLLPDQPPLDDVRVRRAIAHATDRESLAAAHGTRRPGIHGGIVPPGLAGHSPELGFDFDPDRARGLLAESGFSPGGADPPLRLYYLESAHQAAVLETYARQLLDHLGIRVDPVAIPLGTPGLKIRDSRLQWIGWELDYPDPDNVLRQSLFYRLLWNRGWRHQRLEQLLEEAARTEDRRRRLAMYREADRILVNDQAVVIPIGYGHNMSFELLKPWVKAFRQNAGRRISIRDIVVEPH